MIKIICYKDGARKPKAHTKPMGIINSLLIKLGYRTSISYATLEELEKLELMGINTMSEKQEGREYGSSCMTILTHVSPILMRT